MNSDAALTLPQPRPGQTEVTKIVSWNLLRLTGARIGDVVRLARHERPDLLLLQEATREIDALPEYLGGFYHRVPLPGRIHGLAVWSATPRPKPQVIKLPSGAVVDRVCQIIDLGAFSVANVHLSHGQLLNRRQLRHIAQHLPARAAVLGDFNLVGPALLPGFVDAGPREPTHICADMLPLRLDRCYVRGLRCTEAAALHRQTSDHRPIMVRLRIGEARGQLAA
jgi:endonuclease/exonuclease/phosphatase family metal-dependent hydrolase